MIVVPGAAIKSYGIVDQCNINCSVAQPNCRPMKRTFGRELDFYGDEHSAGGGGRGVGVEKVNLERDHKV